MLTMKMAVLAGGAFVFACVCGASAVVNFDAMAPVSYVEPKAVDGQEQARSCEKWDIFGSDKKICMPWNSEETKPVDEPEVACRWDDDVRSTLLCASPETDPGDEIAGPGGMPTYEECQKSWTVGCDLRNSEEPKPVDEGQGEIAGGGLDPIGGGKCGAGRLWSPQCWWDESKLEGGEENDLPADHPTFSITKPGGGGGASPMCITCHIEPNQDDKIVHHDDHSDCGEGDCVHDDEAEQRQSAPDQVASWWEFNTDNRYKGR